MVFRLSGDRKYCFCVVANSQIVPAIQADVSPMDTQRRCTSSLQHSSSWNDCSSSSWDSRCSRRSVLPLIISSGVFMNLQNRETSWFPSGLSLPPYQDAESPDLCNSPESSLLYPLVWLGISQLFPSLPVSFLPIHGNEVRKITSIFSWSLFLKSKSETKPTVFSKEWYVLLFLHIVCCCHVRWQHATCPLIYGIWWQKCKWSLLSTYFKANHLQGMERQKATYFCQLVCRWVKMNMKHQKSRSGKS